MENITLTAIEDINLTFQTDLYKYNEILNAGFILHGHICPAMPLGLRAALEALSRLGIPRARNKELHLIVENGPAHAALCFAEGVQLGTSATFGKDMVTRTNEGKSAFTLIDKKTGRSIRVSMNYDFFDNTMKSEFVNKRREGLEPHEIDQRLPKQMIQNMLDTPIDNLLKFDEIKILDFPKINYTFNYYQCTSCQEPVYEPGIRVLDGEYVCINCSK